MSCNGTDTQRHPKDVTKGWWAEDTAELCIYLHWRTTIAVKSGSKVPSKLIGDALKIYASRWLPNTLKRHGDNKETVSDSDSDSASDITSKHRMLLETIISLRPAEEGAVSCSFLLKLLKAANILNASASSRMGLTTRVGLQLKEATVNDLLIPSVSLSANGTINDVDLVMTILEQFMSQGQSQLTSPLRSRLGFERRRSRSAENIGSEFQESRRSSSASHSSKLKVTKLVDRYLQEIARDVNLRLSKFLAIVETIPDFARLDHDDLYRAMDYYIKNFGFGTFG